MFEIMMKSKTMMEDDYGINIIGWCSDNGPDSKKGHCLMSEAFLWMIILVCWAHQINLVVRDLLGLKHKLIEVIKLALDIICWFNSHSEPLGWLQQGQICTYDKAWTLFLPVLTQWLAHYHTITRLLQMEEAIKYLYMKKRDAMIGKAGNAEKQERVSKVLELIGDPGFWKKLCW
jgi:hypothetical protein